MSKKNTTTTYISDEALLEGRVNDNGLAIRLMQTEFEHMKEGIDEIKTTVKEGFAKVDDSFRELKEEIKDGYATNEQLSGVKDDIADLQDLKKWATRLVIGSAFTTLLGIIGWLATK